MRSFMKSSLIGTPQVSYGMGCALLLILMILLGTLHPIFSAAAFLYVCFIFMKYEASGMILLFLLLPFAGIFKLSPGRTSLFTYLELLYVLRYYAARRFLLSKADLILFVLAFVMLITELLSRTIAVTNTIKVLVNLLLLEIFLSLTRDETRRKTYLWFVAGTIFSSVTSLLLNTVFPIARFLALNQVEQYGQYGARVVRFAGLNVDPNYYTVNVIISLCLLIMLYRRREMSTVRILILASVLGIFAGLTGSKSAILMLAAVMVIYLIACYQGKRYWTLTFSCLVIIVGLAAILSGRIPFFDGALLRFKRSMTDFNSFTTGRLGVWIKYVLYFLTYPEKIILGRGVGIYVLDGRATHNTILDMIYQLGIVGSGIYLYCLHCMIAHHARVLTRRFLNYSGMLCVMVMYFFLSQLQGYDLPFHVFLCVSLWNTPVEQRAVPQSAFRLREREE